MPSFPTNPLMRSGLDAQLDFMTELTRRSYDAMRKLSELNMHLAQQMLQDATDVSRNMLGCSNPVQMMAVAVRVVQPTTEHMRHYQQQLFGMLSGVQLEITRTAETLAPQASRYAAAMAESLAHDSAEAGDAFSHARAPNGSGEHNGTGDRIGAGGDSHGYGGNGAHYTPG